MPFGLIHPTAGFHFMLDIDPRQLTSATDDLMDALKLAEYIVINGERCRIDDCLITTLLDIRMARIFEAYH